MEENIEKQPSSKNDQEEIQIPSDMYLTSAAEALEGFQSNPALSEAAMSIQKLKNNIQTSSALTELMKKSLEHKNIFKSVIQPNSAMFEAMKQLEEHRNAIRDVIQPNSALLDAIKQSQQNQDILKSVLQPNSTFLDAIKQFQQNQDILRNVISTKFVLPNRYEVSELINNIQPSAAVLSISTYLTEIQHAAERMRNPWLNVTNGIQSFNAFAEIQNIGAKLATISPFNDDLVKSLRISLGDWRDKIDWPEKIFTNPVIKTNFYETLGYDQNLVDFPEPAFEETLEIAGIGQSAPTLIDIYGEPIPRSNSEEEEIGFARTNKAHDWLQRLESQIRRFIHMKMLEAFGTNWPKQQVPGEILQDWKEKKVKYEKNRSASQDMHLIEFADFSHYVPIITRKDNWNRVFKPYFHRQENVTESFQRLYPIRIDTMHARIISQNDELLLYVEAERLSRSCKL